MNRVDLRELAVHVTYPAISLFISCDTIGQYHKKIHELLLRAIHELTPRVDKKMLATITEHCNKIQAQIPTDGTYQGIACFISVHGARLYTVPFVVDEQVVVDKMYTVTDILTKLNRAVRYWVVVINKTTPYFFEGYQQQLTEVMHSHSTFVNGQQPVTIAQTARLICDEKLKCRNATTEEFVGAIDKHLQHFIHSDPLPIVLVASEASQADFMNHSEYTDAVAGVVVTDELLSMKDIAQRAWPLIEEYTDAHKKKALKQVREADEAQMCVYDIKTVWKLLHADSIRMLCVDEKLHVPVCEDIVQSAIAQKSDCGSLRAVDAVDEIIEYAHGKNIPIYLCTAAELKKYQGLVAIKR